MQDHFFTKRIRYKCDLGDENLTDFLSEWNRKKGWKTMWSYELYFKKVLNRNEIILNRFVSEVYESADVHIKYDPTSCTLDVILKPVRRAYAVFLIIPVLIWAGIYGENVDWRFWLLPIGASVLTVTLLKWMIWDDYRKIKQELEQKFKDNKRKYIVIH